MFQIFSNQNPVLQISKSSFSYMRLHENNCDISLFLQIDNSLNSLTHFTQSMQIIPKYGNEIICANIIAAMGDFVVSKKINYTCITLSQNKFVLPYSPTAVNLSKCKKTLYFLCKNKKCFMATSMKISSS